MKRLLIMFLLVLMSVAAWADFDRTDPADLTALKNEVLTDPNGYGYSFVDLQAGVVDLINLERPGIVFEKPKVSAATIRSGTTYEAYDGLAIDEQEWLRWMTGSNGFAEENIPVTEDFKARLTGVGGSSLWAVGERTEMEAAMLGIFTRQGSRAEQLFGEGTYIDRSDAGAARDYTP